MASGALSRGLSPSALAADPRIAALLQCGDSPYSYVTEVLCATPEPWQANVLKVMGREHKEVDPKSLMEARRLAIRAGHGVGKTTLVAWVILWFLSTRPFSKVPVIANSEKQLRDTIWAELAIWKERMPNGAAYELTSEMLYLVGKREMCFAVARTATKYNTEALQGFHAENLMFVIEEASGIPDKLFEVGSGALSTPGAIVLMTGNPTRLSGYFYDTFHTSREGWHLVRVSSEDVPRARGHIQDIISRYGKDSNAYRVRVLGEFPLSEDEQVIALEHLEAATTRKAAAIDVAPIWGLDVARFGSDRTALCKRRGNTILEPVKVWQGKDTMQTAGMVKIEYDDTPPGLRPQYIMVDVIGIGAGVVDRLREMGLPALGVNVSESPAVKDRFHRLRDELWWRAREWFEKRDCVIPADQTLISDLAAPQYGFTSSGKLIVESKDDMKKRHVRSPDAGDAFCLTLAGADVRVEQEGRWEKSFRRRDRAFGWQAA